MAISARHLAQISYLLIFIFSFAGLVFAQNKPCKIEDKTLLFSGSAKEQAKCLLRPVKPRGILGDELNSLPNPLSRIIGEKVKIRKELLRHFLVTNNIAEDSLGGSLDDQLSLAVLANGKKIQANYFLIHDTSTPNYLEKMFPADINENTWRGNNVSMWQNQQVAHIFVSRLGESITSVKFSESLPDKKYGTKFARDILKAPAKGLQIHIELIEPRRSDADWFLGNDALAPEPGFPEAQYRRLALLYICASLRRGTWLVPAFHAAVDAGINDAHDDPQNFTLGKFAAEISSLLNALK